MKTFSIAVSSAILGAALLFLLLGRSPAPSGRDVDSVLKAWEAGKAPGTKKVTFVLDDARQGRDPLGAPKEPTPWDRMGAKTRGLLGLREPSKPGPLSETLLQGGDAVFKSYDPLFDKGEEAFVRSLANDILKAHQAGAEIEIVAQGRSAGAALKAIKMLEWDKDKPGVPIRKLVTTGMDEKRLSKQVPEVFAETPRPPNLREWTNLWADRRGARSGLAVTWYSQEGSGGGYLAGGEMLSLGAQQALVRGADESAFDRGVKELGAMLSKLVIRGGQMPSVKPAPGVVPTFDKPPVTASVGLEPPKRVFRDLYGGMSGPRQTMAGPTGGAVGRGGGYGFGEAAAPDMAALQPKREAQRPAQARRPETGPAPAPKKPASFVRVARSEQDILVDDIFKCPEENCWTKVPETIRVLGRLFHETDYDYSLCETMPEGARPKCIRVKAVCNIPEGNYGVVGRAYSFYRSKEVFVLECGDVQLYE